MKFGNEIAFWANGAILVTFLASTAMARFLPRLRSYLVNNGSIIGAVGLFLMLGSVYLAGHGEKDTEYGYVICRYLNTISTDTGILMAINTLLFLLLVIYNRFRCLPPLMVFLALSFITFTILQGKTMLPQAFPAHRTAVIYAFGSLTALFILLYTKTSIWWYSLLIFVFILSHAYRNNYVYALSDDQENNLRYSDTRDAIFSLFSALTYVAVIFAILVNARKRPITFTDSIEDNKKALIILLTFVNSSFLVSLLIY